MTHYELKGYPICERCSEPLYTQEEQKQELCEPCYKEWKSEEINWDVNKLVCRKIAHTQDDISFKAGFQEALNTVVATAQYDEGKKAGIKEGITLFAWWKDGTQYVGSGVMTLKRALEEVE